MSKVGNVKTATIRIIKTLFNDQYVNKAALANLRTAPKITSPRAETVWPVILPCIPNNLLNIKNEPSWGENAIYTATHLFALYQQGNDDLVYAPVTQGADENVKLFFNALAVLRQNPDKQDALDRRVQALLGNNNFEGMVHAMTQLLSILKSSKLPIQIDFAKLAQDLFNFQISFEAASQVKLAWGQQYYRFVKTPQTKGEQQP